MKTRISSLILALIMCLALSPTALASENIGIPTINEITVAIPAVRDFFISFTNVPVVCTEYQIYPGVLHQFKFYYTEDTTITFDRDLMLGLYGTYIDGVAGEPIKPADYADTPIAFRITTSNNDYSLDNALDIDVQEGQVIYQIDFVSSEYIGKNIEEGYELVYVDTWNADCEIINVDYNKDGESDFSYSLPGATHEGTVTMAEHSELKDQFEEVFIATAGKTYHVYQIPVGQNISLAGAYDFLMNPMDIRDGILYDLYGPSGSVDCITVSTRPTRLG